MSSPERQHKPAQRSFVWRMWFGAGLGMAVTQGAQGL